MTSARSVVGGVARVFALSAVVMVLVAAVGYLPTKRMGGSSAVPAMLAGCLVSLAASVIGSIPLVVGLHGPARNRANAILLSTALRLAVVLVLALAVALSGWFDRTPLLIWLAISYVLLLLVDTVYAVRLSGSADDPEK